MYDLPDAKRIRRSDLYARSQSSSPAPCDPDPELEARLREHLASWYGSELEYAPCATGSTGRDGVISQITSGNADVDTLVDANVDAEEEGFEFRLFSSASGECDGRARKILLDDADLVLGEGGFVKARVPRGWVVGEGVGWRRGEIESVAVSGEEVLRRGRGRAWGLEVPWRVRVLNVSGGKKGDNWDYVGGVVKEDEDVGGKRKRPGKKRRVLLRERRRKDDEVAEKRRRDVEGKEDAEKEKRVRRNREKKMKRRAKEKAEKVKKIGGGELLESAGTDGGHAVVGEDENHSGSEALTAITNQTQRVT